MVDASYQGTEAGRDDGPAAKQFIALLRMHAGRLIQANESLKRGPHGAPFRGPPAVRSSKC